MPSRTLEVATQVTGLFPIGIPFIVFENMTGVKLPDNSGSAKYIKLSAGLTGSGEFNEGLLTNESVSGSAPLVEATAEIATGPLQGETIHLINTEEAFLRARETSGVLQMDQMQRITGEWTSLRTRFEGSSSGAITVSDLSQGSATSGGADGLLFKFDSANSPDARTSSTTSGETRSKNVSGTAYMRIA